MKTMTHNTPYHWHPLLPGFGLVLLGGALVLLASQLPLAGQLGIGSLTLAILLGMLAGNTLYPAVEQQAAPGVGWMKHHALRWGIMLYGFRISLAQVMELGPSVLLIDMLTLGSTFLLACWLGIRWLGMKRESVWLIGAGSSICGAAAVIATSSVLQRHDNRDVAVAIATVVTFGTLAMFLYPLLYQWLPAGWQVSPELFGIYIGSTVHEVAQVVAAGEAVGLQTGETAVIAKMLRVMMLAPFLLLLAGWARRGTAQADTTAGALPVPWFAVVFLGVAAFNSLDLLPAMLVQLLVTLDQILLVLAMFALGLETRWLAIRQSGLRPLLLAGMLMLWLVLGGATINYGVALLL